MGRGVRYAAARARAGNPDPARGIFAELSADLHGIRRGAAGAGGGLRRGAGEGTRLRGGNRADGVRGADSRAARRARGHPDVGADGDAGAGVQNPLLQALPEQSARRGHPQGLGAVVRLRVADSLRQRVRRRAPPHLRRDVRAATLPAGAGGAHHRLRRGSPGPGAQPLLDLRRRPGGGAGPVGQASGRAGGHPVPAPAAGHRVGDPSRQRRAALRRERRPRQVEGQREARRDARPVVAGPFQVTRGPCRSGGRLLPAGAGAEGEGEPGGGREEGAGLGGALDAGGFVADGHGAGGAVGGDFHGEELVRPLADGEFAFRAAGRGEARAVAPVWQERELDFVVGGVAGEGELEHVDLRAGDRAIEGVGGGGDIAAFADFEIEDRAEGQVVDAAGFLRAAGRVAADEAPGAEGRAVGVADVGEPHAGGAHDDDHQPVALPFPVRPHVR